MFDDLVEGNRRYVARFTFAEVPSRPARKLAVLCCIDSRVDPLQILGLDVGDIKVLRNAGARVTPDVLRSLAAAVALLGVERVAVVHHTDCAMTRVTDDEIVEAIGRRGGTATMRDFDVIDDESADLRADVERIRESPMLPGVPVAGFRYDVHTGQLRREV